MDNTELIQALLKAQDDHIETLNRLLEAEKRILELEARVQSIVY